MRVRGDVRTCPGPKAARPRHTDTRARRCLFRETFCLQSVVHLRASANASMVGCDIRIGLEIDPDEVRPVYYGEGVRIGDREVAPHQVLAVRELIVEIRQPLVDVGLRRIFGIVRRGLVEERAEVFVKFGSY